MNREKLPDIDGHFGIHGGRFVPETLMTPLEELSEMFEGMNKDEGFQNELSQLLREFAGRPTPLYFSRFLSAECGFKVYLKREDLLHTGAHKINNTLGQALLAKWMGKRRIIAETGAGQHGVATATACALLGLQCDIYMGSVDIERQRPNIWRMALLGANVISVETGSKTLKDAVNEALRDWVANVEHTYYILGSVVGPHPYPEMVRTFQSVIGKETREQIILKEARTPDLVIACVGGGSNSIGIFYPFISDESVKLLGVEAGGIGNRPGQHAARMLEKKKGVLHGTHSYLLQDEHGQVAHTHSISAGLDYPLIGPEHAQLNDSGRAQYSSINDEEALAAFHLLCRREGIIPALESSHAIAQCLKLKGTMSKNDIVVICLSGRGDKDVKIVRNSE